VTKPSGCDQALPAKAGLSRLSEGVSETDLIADKTTSSHYVRLDESTRYLLANWQTAKASATLFKTAGRRGRAGKIPLPLTTKPVGGWVNGGRLFAGVMILLAAVCVSGHWTMQPAVAQCGELPPCKGCGCRGGPGYRSKATGQCVGYRTLEAKCGNPPTLRCRFENAPGTRLNRECVLGKPSDQAD